MFRNGTLVIEKVQSGVDGGTYRCEATNKQKDTARGTAQINVMGKYHVQNTLDLKSH